MLFGYNINLIKLPDLNTVAISPTAEIAYYCPNLIEVESLKFSEYADNETIMFSPFPYCNNLTKIKFDSIIYINIRWFHNPNLSNESLISMINALADYSDMDHVGYISLYQPLYDKIIKITNSGEANLLNQIANKGWTLTLYED